MVYKLNSLKLLNVSFSSYILVDNNCFIHIVIYGFENKYIVLWLFIMGRWDDGV